MIAVLINPYVLYQSLNVPWLKGLLSWIDVASSDTSSVVLGFCVASISTYVTYVKLRYYGLTLPTDVITGLSLFPYQVM